MNPVLGAMPLYAAPMDTRPDRAAPDATTALPGSERLGHLLWETSARVLLLSEPVFRDSQLSQPSIGALERIAAFPGITASELARQAFKTQQAVSQVTGRLERLGYVERRVGQGRGVGLYITESGRHALARGNEQEIEFDRRLQELLGSGPAGELRALLIELRDRLADVTGD
jgi:DNA-binding MarR family transcriptional regulator